MADYPQLERYWDQAANILNGYVQGEGGGTIDWGRARKAFEQAAMSGQGNLGDWVNATMAQKSSWVNVPSSSAASGDAGASQAEGAYNLPGFVERWRATAKNYRNKDGLIDVQRWLNDNRDVAQGVQFRDDGAYTGSGALIGDMIGDFGPGGENSVIYLDPAEIAYHNARRAAKAGGGGTAPKTPIWNTGMGLSGGGGPLGADVAARAPSWGDAAAPARIDAGAPAPNAGVPALQKPMTFASLFPPQAPVQRPAPRQNAYTSQQPLTMRNLYQR